MEGPVKSVPFKKQVEAAVGDVGPLLVAIIAELAGEGETSFIAVEHEIVRRFALLTNVRCKETKPVPGLIGEAIAFMIEIATDSYQGRESLIVTEARIGRRANSRIDLVDARTADNREKFLESLSVVIAHRRLGSVMRRLLQILALAPVEGVPEVSLVERINASSTMHGRHRASERKRRNEALQTLIRRLKGMVEIRDGRYHLNALGKAVVQRVPKK